MVRLYLIEILHQTTTCKSHTLGLPLLYLIEILHQTTTRLFLPRHPLCCILSKFYIKPQLPAPTLYPSISCILSKFYIKPQQYRPYDINRKRCILSKFYIKPQLNGALKTSNARCILSKFYIKPQLEDAPEYVSRVVSYRNSTSNHN